MDGEALPDDRRQTFSNFRPLDFGQLQSSAFTTQLSVHRLSVIASNVARDSGELIYPYACFHFLPQFLVVMST